MSDPRPLGNDGPRCITCSDAAELMRITAITDDASLGVGVDERGNLTSVMLDLVPGARIGTRVLVHAGVALLVVQESTSAEATP